MSDIVPAQGRGQRVVTLGPVLLPDQTDAAEGLSAQDCEQALRVCLSAQRSPLAADDQVCDEARPTGLV